VTPVLLGLGSNLGNREERLRAALDLLEDGGRVRVVRTSAFRETEPVGGPPQGKYLNGVAFAETNLDPEELLLLLKDVEVRIGRRPGGERWGPREIDLDLLLYGDRVIERPGLIVPHPRLPARRFVLEPAAEVAPTMEHPVLRRSLASLLRELGAADAGVPTLLRTVEDLRAWVRAARRNRLTTGMVPTMGALHDGHGSLFRAAVRDCDRTLATVFVNPRQFDDPRDLERYPRTLEADLALAGRHGVDAVFAPSAEEMYPAGYATKVEVQGLSSVLEGAVRPGHFAGVATVVCRLLALALPDRAYFGQKDAQQVVVVRRMVRDLGIPCDVVVMPIVRDADGLAMSSRNRFLSAEERRRALALPAGLRAAREAYGRGERDAAGLVALARAPLDAAGLPVDYLVCADPESLEPLAGPVGRALLLAAVRVGKVRLLDNEVLGG
jgi:pantoate--beta-alanine ligase